jgi:hypothetical protein
MVLDEVAKPMVSVLVHERGGKAHGVSVTPWERWQSLWSHCGLWCAGKNKPGTGGGGEGTYNFWTPPRDHPPPKPKLKSRRGITPPPFQCPHPDRKGTNLLLFQFCIHLHTVAELWDKNTDMDAHAHMTYPAPITGLHSPTLLPFLQNSPDYLMLAQSCKFGVNCCVIGLTHPAACTRVRVPLTNTV